jgi:methyl-accepting chemotaxis protein
MTRTRQTLRYDWYGFTFGLGLPLVGTAIEALRLYHTVAFPALLRAHLGQPLLWIMDTTPVVLGLLGRIILDQQETVLRQSDELVAVEQARREGFEATARRLSLAAQALLGTVSDFTTTTGEAAHLVRRVTETMNALAQAASAAALTADTVIGIGVQAERASADGLRQVEASGAELLRLAEEVREFTGAIDALTGPLAELREQSGLVAELAGRADQLAELAAQAEGGAAPRSADLTARLRAHAAEALGAAAHLQQLQATLQQGKDAAASAAQAGGERAVASARVATRTSETMRGLAVSLRESARAAREIARVAQQQEGDIEQVLKAMNEIAHATEGTVVSTRHVEGEAASLNELAASLQDAVKRR